MAEAAELDTAQDTIEPSTIEATLNYIVADGSKVFTVVATPGARDGRYGGTPDPHQIALHNGRPHAKDFALERDGFRFVRHDTKMKDFYDEDEIKRVYYPEMEALIKAESGARRVVVFDHTLRTADDELRESKKIREVVRRVHNDYTEWSGPQRVRDIYRTKRRNCSSGALPSSRCGARSAIRSRRSRWRWPMPARCRRTT